MILTGLKPSGYSYTTLTTAVTTVSSVTTAVAVYIVAETTYVRYRLDGNMGAASNDDGFLLNGTARESTYWLLGGTALQNLEICCPSSGATSNARIQFFDKE